MRRFIVEGSHWDEDRVNLPAETARHLGTVLRLVEGDEVILLDGTGRCARCRLERLDKKGGKATIETHWLEKEACLPVTLIQGVAKGEKMEWLLQKNTELGVSAVLPVQTERSIPQLKGDRAAKRQARWSKIMLEAARQSGRPVVPQVHPVQRFEQGLDQCGAELKLMLWEEETTALQAVFPVKSPASVALLVGPEGGFSQREAKAAHQAGFLSVSLGPRVLRTETAGIAMLSILQYIYGDMGQGLNRSL